ncbi:MAG: thioredoxin TrxC [Acidobacteria bacterium]|nr:thioredoxin TrxC [Acidobacteriota bacterium]
MGDSTTICKKCGARNRLGIPKRNQVPVCGQCANPLPWVVDGTDHSFKKELETSVPVLVDFWAPWCAPCRVTTPVLEDLAGERAGRIKILKINVDQNPEIAGNYNIRSIPTLILFKGGNAVESVVGALPKEALLERLGPHLK